MTGDSSVMASMTVIALRLPTGIRFFCSSSAYFSMFSNESSPYKTLGLNSNASVEDIKAAYFRESKKYHPDVDASDEAKLKYEQIRSAYDVLSDAKKKLDFDTRQAQSKKYGNYGRPKSGYSDYESYLRQRHVDQKINEYRTAAYERSRKRRFKEYMSNPPDFDSDWDDEHESKSNYYRYDKSDPLHPDSQRYRKFESYVVRGTSYRSRRETKIGLHDQRQRQSRTMAILVLLMTLTSGMMLIESLEEAQFHRQAQIIHEKEERLKRQRQNKSDE